MFPGFAHKLDVCVLFGPTDIKGNDHNWLTVTDTATDTSTVISTNTIYCHSISDTSIGDKWWVERVKRACVWYTFYICKSDQIFQWSWQIRATSEQKSFQICRDHHHLHVKHITFVLGGPLRLAELPQWDQPFIYMGWFASFYSDNLCESHRSSLSIF